MQVFVVTYKLWEMGSGRFLTILIVPRHNGTLLKSLEHPERDFCRKKANWCSCVLRD